MFHIFIILRRYSQFLLCYFYHELDWTLTDALTAWIKAIVWTVFLLLYNVAILHSLSFLIFHYITFITSFISQTYLPERNSTWLVYNFYISGLQLLIFFHFIIHEGYSFINSFLLTSLVNLGTKVVLTSHYELRNVFSSSIS